MKWRDLAVQIKDMKHYFIAAAATMLIGMYLGYSHSHQFQFLLDDQIDQLTEIVNKISGKDHTQLRLLFYVFANNILISLFMVYSGVLLGIIPLFSLLSNGLILGYLAHQNVPQDGWGSFLIAVLPHGIIEIPAFIIACAYGIKFGSLVAKGILFLPAPSRRAANNLNFSRLLKVSVPLALLLCGLLLAAAVMESMVTYAIVK
jgi:stage II sporulation protein M